MQRMTGNSYSFVIMASLALATVVAVLALHPWRSQVRREGPYPIEYGYAYRTMAPLAPWPSIFNIEVDAPERPRISGSSLG